MRPNENNIEQIEISEIRVIYKKSDELNAGYIKESIINWYPPYDLYIIDEMIFISIELPGVKLKDITIYVGQKHMTISGIKKTSIIEKRTEKKNVIFHNLEIAYGRFFRNIEFPLPVDPKYGDYKLEQGVLTIKFPVLRKHIIPIEEI